MSEALRGADVFIGVSAPNILKESDIAGMNKDAIVFALANPDPEIAPELAAKHARIVATGRSDYPNQINNVLAFPGLFRGLLDAHVSKISDEMLAAAAIAIDSQNLRRVIRALEVIEITGKPYTANLPQEGASYYPDAIWIGLSVPREVLDERITKRAKAMFENGLIEEVRDLVLDGLMNGTTARMGHGYGQIIEWQMGLNADPIEETIIVTRQYARRQETWFKREKRINWIEAPFLPKALELLK